MSVVVTMVKRWWVLFVIFGLALSLTSCSKKKIAGVSNYGYAQCDDPNLGSFDVYVYNAVGMPGMYKLSIIPAAVNNGDIVRISVENSNRTYKPMLSETVVNTYEEIFAGFLSESDLQTYNILAITRFSYDNSQPYSYQSPQGAVRCVLPMPGDGSSSYGQQGY